MDLLIILYCTSSCSQFLIRIFVDLINFTRKNSFQLVGTHLFPYSREDSAKSEEYGDEDQDDGDGGDITSNAGAVTVGIECRSTLRTECIKPAFHTDTENLWPPASSGTVHHTTLKQRERGLIVMETILHTI